MRRSGNKTTWSGWGVCLALMAGTGLGFYLGGSSAGAQGGAGETEAGLRERVAALEALLPQAGTRPLAGLPIPAAATLCGQPVPLERPDVREALAYELVLTAGRPLMPMLWMRRAPGTLPLIESRLRARGFPEDLKYLAMIESDLRWTNRSPAGALGLWQFMQATGSRYGLKVDRFIDERLDPDRSTEAALSHLGDLQRVLGDWFLALAAYNAGEGAVRRAAQEQPGASYFDLYLPAETRRYVYRMLAAKLVMEQPERYGLVALDPIFVPRFKTAEVEVKGAAADLRALSRERGWNYLGVRVANPQILGPTLPKGRHSLRIPEPAIPPGVDG